jgi:hypothetical protein
VPAESKVIVSPFADAIFGLSISMVHEPAELEIGGTKVMVF